MPGRALGCPSALLSRMPIVLIVGFNRAVVEIRRPFVPQGWREVHWAEKKIVKLLMILPLLKKSFVLGGEKKYTLVQETNKSIMQKYLTSFMNPIHWQVDHCNSYELGNRCYISAVNLSHRTTLV